MVGLGVFRAFFAFTRRKEGGRKHCFGLHLDFFDTTSRKRRILDDGTYHAAAILGRRGGDGIGQWEGGMASWVGSVSLLVTSNFQLSPD